MVPVTATNRDQRPFRPGWWLQPGRKLTLLSRFEARIGTKGHFRGTERARAKRTFSPGSNHEPGQKVFWKLNFLARRPQFSLFFEKSTKFINSISFDLFIRKMQLKYQIVHKNVIYLFVTNSFLFEI